MTRAEVITRFRASGPAGARRGDHDLNPGLDSADRLTRAAVLVPLVERPGELSVLLTQRTAHLRDHAGQISFPGGRIEADDASPEAAALREVEEEIGLPPARVDIVGRLDDYETRTGFCVTPVVGIVMAPLRLRLDEHEVAEAFELALAFILDPANHQLHSRELGGKMLRFHAFSYHDRYIWGATAGILINLYEVLSG